MSAMQLQGGKLLLDALLDVLHSCQCGEEVSFSEGAETAAQNRQWSLDALDVHNSYDVAPKMEMIAQCFGECAPQLQVRH